MAINKNTIKLAMRRRVITAANISALTQYQVENAVIDPTGLSLWIAEYIVMGNEATLSPIRSRCNGFVCQYDVFCPINADTGTADTAVQAILDAFDVADKSKSSFSESGHDILVSSVKTENNTQKEWRRESIVITLDVTCVKQPAPIETPEDDD